MARMAITFSLVLMALVMQQTTARPQFGFLNPFAGGNGAGFGAGHAGPSGVSSVGVGMASAHNGGFAFGSGHGMASSNLFNGFQANGNGQGFGFGR